MGYPAFETGADSAIETLLMTKADWESGAAGLSETARAFAVSQGFKGATGQLVINPDDTGRPALVLFGLGAGEDRLAVASLSARLQPGAYRVMHAPADWTFAQIAAGWSDGAYRFDRYKAVDKEMPRLCLDNDQAAPAIDAEAVAVGFLRDLVNTPAQDMGPADIEIELRNLATTYEAEIEVISGQALLDENYPMIHAVGRAAGQEPRLVTLSWGDPSHPELALVGKGVAFDTGGLNLKPGQYMRHMKKDMGGAAHAAALARLVMAHNLPVRLNLYIPAVENAISGEAFRPGDILSTRKGLTVEIDNTDAEGRLILGDALTRASESDPDLLIDFATLTGAARVALGQDLAPFYTSDDALAAAITEAAQSVGDPCWRMPLWMPYKSMLKSSVADIVNAGGSQAGSITAAVFLSQFVDANRWVHFDIWAWRMAKYGRPEGAAACGLRAVFKMLQDRYAD